MKRIKRTNDELKADRPTIDEVKDIPKLPISILVENVRSVHNVGSIFRSADGFGAEKDLFNWLYGLSTQRRFK